MILQMTEYVSPLGPLVIAAEGDTLRVLAFRRRWAEHRARLERRQSGARFDRVSTLPVCALLDAYFGGDLAALERIPVEPLGTPFQRRVWGRLRAIPAGATASYGELARAIGAPAAVRAVGAANGANPISVVLPCHRVVGSKGTLTGYGGGLERKRWLLAHERRFA